MGKPAKTLTASALMLCICAGPAFAEPSADDRAGAGAVVTLNTLATTPEYPVLTRGQVVLVNAQRFVVTREPRPAAKVAEAPPAPQASELDRPTAPQAGAVWVEAHWIYGPTGFSWVAGRYVVPRAGHVFVPP
ncbi:MAG: hypothetical protein JRF55_12765, partial [Deltaproteobacteria bacterium]|nr:hypothetical protein [Deltaproteobacteria bacterium]